MPWQFTIAQSLGRQPEQQDAVAAWPSPEGNLFAVLCDGAGGHCAGAEASRAVISRLESLWKNTPALAEPGDFLREACRLAHEAVAALGPTPRGTFAALLLRETDAHWAHSGDSRIYHFAHGRLLSRTRDHSVVEALLEKGKISKAEAANHPDRSRLLQGLGGREFSEPDLGAARISEADNFLLCSDGFWSEISETELIRLASAPSPSTARAAIGRITPADNASLLLAWRDRAV